ncbi:MAG TPA: hypothetical protein EYQ18_19285 [Candidatus Handelsmanbacteria bacterium]|nr:hypothetical protein [Candidatus Handelsmanbacteria bacterium]
MAKWLNTTTTLALCAAFVMTACGDGEKSKVLAPDQEPAAQLPPEAVQVTGLLVASFQKAFFASLLADTTSVPGVSGSVEVMGNDWVLQDFSPDGMIVLNGALLVGKEQYPVIPVSGTIEVTGSQESTMVLDMVVSVADTELSPTGTLTIDGVEFDIAALVTAAAATAAAAEGG